MRPLPPSAPGNSIASPSLGITPLVSFAVIGGRLPSSGSGVVQWSALATFCTGATVACGASTFGVCGLLDQ